MGILDRVRMYFKNALSSIWQGDSLFQHPRFTVAKNLLHVTIVANGRALVKYLLAKLAHHHLLLYERTRERNKVLHGNEGMSGNGHLSHIFHLLTRVRANYGFYKPVFSNRQSIFRKYPSTLSLDSDN